MRKALALGSYLSVEGLPALVTLPSVRREFGHD